MCLHTFYVYNFTLYIENTLFKKSVLRNTWMMCFMVSWLISSEESSMVMFLWKLRNWLFMLLQWKVTVYDKHTIPSCQKLLTAPILTRCCWPRFAEQFSAQLITLHTFLYLWLWKSLPTSGIKTWENYQNLARLRFLPVVSLN